MSIIFGESGKRKFFGVILNLAITYLQSGLEAKLMQLQNVKYKHECAVARIFAIFKLATLVQIRQITKINSLSNFPTIQCVA